MWRMYDWSCVDCAHDHEEAIEYPQGEDPPDIALMVCPGCGLRKTHRRAKINMVGQYLGDRPSSPMVKGGSFDTEGYKRMRSIPEFVGSNASDFRDFTQTKEYKEAKREREHQRKENRAKKERAKLIRKGANISIRHNPLPGDPKF